jgi:predicted secreted Zn-dependent protease
MSLSSVARTGFVLPQWARRAALLLCGIVMFSQGILVLMRGSVGSVSAAQLIPPIGIVTSTQPPVATTSSQAQATRTRFPAPPAAQSRTAQQTQTKQCAKASLKRPAGLPLNADGLMRVVETPHYYSVYGQTVEQISQQLAQCSPTGYFATTNYNMNWTYSTQNVGGGRCAISRVRVGMHIIVQYPMWQDDGNAPDNVRSQWQKLSANLVAHEQGHVTRNVQTAQSLVGSLRAIQPASCAGVKAKAASVIADHYARLRASHTSYDTETNHGQTQGAWL